MASDIDITEAIADASRLTQSFYERPTQTVAAELIGKALLHRVKDHWVGGWIVETEAYLDRRDPASHSSRGLTASNASMFSAAGTLYVYPIHAKFCLNAVTQPAGEGAAVLIRSLEPVWGISTMRRHRERDDLKRLSRGPAMICQALGINRRDDGRDLTTDKRLGIYDLPAAARRRVQSTRRIGISKAIHRKLRFIDCDSKYLSRPR